MKSRPFSCESLLHWDKVSLDTCGLNDERGQDVESLPDADVLAAETAGKLWPALE